MSIILTLILLSGATLDVEMYTEYTENDNGDLTDEQHFYTVVEDAKGNVLFTIDKSSDDISVLY